MYEFYNGSIYYYFILNYLYLYIMNIEGYFYDFSKILLIFMIADIFLSYIFLSNLLLYNI